MIVGGILLTLLELFICFLQAFIFTFLTVLFISMVATITTMITKTSHDALPMKARWTWTS